MYSFNPPTLLEVTRHRNWWNSTLFSSIHYWEIFDWPNHNNNILSSRHVLNWNISKGVLEKYTVINYNHHQVWSSFLIDIFFFQKFQISKKGGRGLRLPPLENVWVIWCTDFLTLLWIADRLISTCSCTHEHF